MTEVEARMLVLWQRWTSMTTEPAAGGGLSEGIVVGGAKG